MHTSRLFDIRLYLSLSVNYNYHIIKQTVFEDCTNFHFYYCIGNYKIVVFHSKSMILLSSFGGLETKMVPIDI